MAVMRAIVLALALLIHTGCSTTRSLWGSDAEPRPYSGVRSLPNNSQYCILCIDGDSI